MVDQNPREAIPRLQELFDLAMEAERSDIAAHGLANKALAHARLGEFAEAEKELARALELAESADVPVKKADVHMVASLVSLDMDQVEDGLEFARQGVEEAAGAGAGECTIYGMFCVGQAKLRVPELDAARSSFSMGLQRTENVRSEALAYMNRVGLAQTDSMTNREEAVAQLESVLEQAKAFREVYTEAQLSQNLAELLIRLGDWQRAEEHLNNALAYYRRNDMLPYLVKAVGLAAHVYEKQGRAADAAAAGAELESLRERYDRALLARDEVLAAV
jgi:tetratricopeptide (TPR) repeat protein